MLYGGCASPDPKKCISSRGVWHYLPVRSVLISPVKLVLISPFKLKTQIGNPYWITYSISMLLLSFSADAKVTLLNPLWIDAWCSFSPSQQMQRWSFWILVLLLSFSTDAKMRTLNRFLIYPGFMVCFTLSAPPMLGHISLPWCLVTSRSPDAS